MRGPRGEIGRARWCTARVENHFGGELGSPRQNFGAKKRAPVERSAGALLHPDRKALKTPSDPKYRKARSAFHHRCSAHDRDRAWLHHSGSTTSERARRARLGSRCVWGGTSWGAQSTLHPKTCQFDLAICERAARAVRALGIALREADFGHEEQKRRSSMRIEALVITMSTERDRRPNGARRRALRP